MGTTRYVFPRKWRSLCRCQGAMWYPGSRCCYVVVKGTCGNQEVEVAMGTFHKISSSEQKFEYCILTYMYVPWELAQSWTYDWAFAGDSYFPWRCHGYRLPNDKQHSCQFGPLFRLVTMETVHSNMKCVHYVSLVDNPGNVNKLVTRGVAITFLSRRWQSLYQRPLPVPADYLVPLIWREM